MSSERKRIKVVIRPDGMITAETEGMYGGDCLPYMAVVFNALQAIPAVSPDEAHSLLSDDFYVKNPEEESTFRHTLQKNYNFE